MSAGLPGDRGRYLRLNLLEVLVGSGAQFRVVCDGGVPQSRDLGIGMLIAGLLCQPRLYPVDHVARPGAQVPASPGNGVLDTVEEDVVLGREPGGDRAR